MATEVYTTKEIRLLDETEVMLKPLPIAKLRKFTRMWSDHVSTLAKEFAASDGNLDDINSADITDRQFDTFIKMCALGLESQLKGDKTDKQFLSYLEDVLDEKTIHEILWVTGGLKMEQDPNLPSQTQSPGAGIQ